MFSVHVLRCSPRREFRKAKCRCGVGTDRDGGAAKGGTDPMVRLPSGGHACAPGMRPGAALFETNETSARVEPYPIPFPWPLLYALLCFACFTLLGVQKPCPVPSVWPAPHIQIPHKTNPLVHKHRKRASHSHHHTIPYQSIHRPTQTHQPIRRRTRSKAAWSTLGSKVGARLIPLRLVGPGPLLLLSFSRASNSCS